MHGNELRLLKAYIEAKGYEIKETDRGSGEGFIFNYKVTKKPMATKKIRKSIDDSYTPEFNSAWGLYPKRAGGNSKAAAYKAWSARVSSSRFENGLESIEEMHKGAERYAKYIREKGDENTQYVMMARTFFGPSKHYLEEWTLPVKKVKELKLPYDNENLAAFAAEHNLSKPKAGKSYMDYRRKLQAEFDLINNKG